MVKDAQKFVEELRMDLKLQHPDPTGRTSEGEGIETSKFGDWIKKEVQRPRKVSRMCCQVAVLLDRLNIFTDTMQQSRSFTLSF